ncbi:MAG: hypothetical protein EBZ83_01220 [Verrucomicrobia bacterium]|nr:hypothetical protein [Verrucomicrobiota bacterium]NDC00036.1 hypothetical protein [Verrucomicrobiota bacterium]NDF16643.1 hypothetical protein [Verrucomicrobiota bacterium]
MADSQAIPAEEPRILPSEPPGWLSAKVLVPVAMALTAGLGILLWSASKSENSKNEASRLLAEKPGPETWEKLIRDYPGQPATALAILNAAEEAASKKDHRKAAELYEVFVRQFPKHPLLSSARLGEANQLALAGNGASAQALYLRIVTERPRDPFHTAAAVGLARILIEEKRPEAARQVLKDALAENSGSAFLPDVNLLLQQLPPSPSGNPQPTPSPGAQR